MSQSSAGKMGLSKGSDSLIPRNRSVSILPGCSAIALPESIWKAQKESAGCARAFRFE